jgi:hypothetical protein
VLPRLSDVVLCAAVLDRTRAHLATLTASALAHTAAALDGSWCFDAPVTGSVST